MEQSGRGVVKPVDILLYLGLGSIAGLLAGMFGVGGGLIIVPALLWAFRWQQFDVSVLTHLAVGTSLATIVVTSLSSTWAHHQHGAVVWSVVLKMAPGIAAGSALGALTATGLSGSQLTLAFSLFMLAIATQMLLDYRVAAGRQLPGPGILAGVGVVIGWVSALFGIGGGSLSVPFLNWCNVTMQRSVAISAACGLPIALVGSSMYLMAGLGRESLPAHSTGFVYWPAFFGIVLASSLSARLGARMANRLPASLLKRSFALFLFVVGGKLLLESGAL